LHDGAAATPGGSGNRAHGSACRAGRADERWVKLPTEPYTLNDKQDAIAFADALTGLYGNGTGRIYRTDDGGEACTAIWSKRGTYVRALEFADAQTGFLDNVGPTAASTGGG